MKLLLFTTITLIFWLLFTGLAVWLVQITGTGVVVAALLGFLLGSFGICIGGLVGSHFILD